MQVQDLTTRAERIAVLLKGRRETIAVAESSTGGLISAALLGVAGASSYFLGGAVVYTQTARRALLDIPDSAMAGLRPSTEAYALLLGRTARTRFGAAWALGETGATGPTGNRYGDAAGHSCIAVVGPGERAITRETGSADRLANMQAFAAAALDLLESALRG
jgi:PncC family amidohydrolase